jgi:hypothetical protein
MLKYPNPSAFVVEKLVVDLSCTLLYEILSCRPTTFSYDGELCRPFVFAQSFTTTTTSKIHPDFGNDHVLNPKASLSLSLSLSLYIYIYTHNQSSLLLVTPTGFIFCTSLLMFAVCANPL